MPTLRPARRCWTVRDGADRRDALQDRGDRRIDLARHGETAAVAGGGTPSGWASETAARPETATPSFVELAPPMGELYDPTVTTFAMARIGETLFRTEAIAASISRGTAKPPLSGLIWT
jgi:hypothetical protein